MAGYIQKTYGLIYLYLQENDYDQYIYLPICLFTISTIRLIILMNVLAHTVRRLSNGIIF